MSTLRRRPVSRAKVAAGTVLALAVLGGVVALSEWLRPGTGPGEPMSAEHDADPRIAVDCQGAQPREGQRAAATADEAAQRVASSDLYDCPAVWDGRTVRFRGEVVGGVLQRGDAAWLQLNDDAYATQPGPLPFHRDFRGGNGGVGVLVPLAHIAAIEHVGGPRLHGDEVEVTGVFHRVDPQTREIAIIRAETLRVVQRGRPLTQPVEPERLAVAVVLGALAVALLLLQWRLRHRD